MKLFCQGHSRNRVILFHCVRYATAQGPSFERSVTSGYSRADPSARGAPKKFEFTFPNSNLPPSGSEVSQLCFFVTVFLKEQNKTIL